MSVASTEFEAYLIISAVSVLVKIFGVLVDAAHHDAVGLGKILYGCALGEELRIHAEPESRARLLAGSAFHGAPNHSIGGAGHHRALHYHRVEGILAGNGCADFFGGALDIGQVDAPACGGRAHRDEGEVGGGNRSGKIARCAQRLAHGVLQQFRQTVLMDRRLARIDPLHLGGVDIHAHHIVTAISQAGARDQAHIPRANDRDAHQAAAAVRLCEYQTRDL
jgi:hypothetical protein